MSETQKLPICGKCGAALSGYAPDGLCAACLLESAFEAGDATSVEPSRPSRLLAFQDYEVQEEIARGGMGVVYRGRQISLNRPVAIKMILGGHLANAAEMKRFRAEAETAAQLQHPNIVAIHEVGEHAGQPFFSMALVDGRNLAQLVRDDPLPARKAATYLKTIAEAVQYAHSRGVLHRDLKPSNILIDDSDQPRITDFGLAKRLDSQPSTNDPQLTQTGQVLGSPSFIPPEQAAGQKDAIGPASDVYSLGAILYHCLTARPPFMAESLTQTLRLVAEQEPVSPRLLNASVPRDLETICLKCLEKDPERRYAAACDLAEELDRFLRHEPIQARPAGIPLKLHRWCLRNKSLAVAGTAALVLLLIVAIGSPIAAFRISRERAKAEAARQNEVRLRKQAETQELAMRRTAYASDMQLVQQALRVNWLGHARDLLNDYSPRPGGSSKPDLRGWEWRYLWQFTKDDIVEKSFHDANGSAVISVSFSRDGKLLALAQGSGELTVWDVATGELIFRDEPSEKTERKARFSATDDLLAYYDRSSIVLWSTRTHAELRRLPVGAYVRELAFTRDGRLFTASPSIPEGVILWDVGSGQAVRRFPARIPENSAPIPFAVSPDGRRFAHVSGYHDVRIVNTDDGVEWTFEASDDSVMALAFSVDGRKLATGSGYSEGVIKLWDVESRQSVGLLVGHTAWISGLKFLADGKTIASASGGDKTVRLWDVETRHQLNLLRGRVAEALSIDTSPDGRSLASGLWTGQVFLWDTTSTTARLPTFRTLPTGGITSWAFSPDNRFVAAVQQGKLKLYDATTLNLSSEPLPWLTNITACAFSPDMRTLVATDAGGHLCAWNFKSQGVLTNLTAHAGPAYVSGDSFLSAGKRLLTWSGDHVVKEWDVTTWQELRHWSIPIGPEFVLAFSPAADVAVAAYGWDIEVISTSDPSNRRHLASQHYLQHLALSPDGKTLGTSSQGGTIELFDVATGASSGPLSLSRGDVGLHSVTFSTDGSRVIAGSGNGKQAITVVDLHSRKTVAVLEGGGSSFDQAAFSPDGQTIGARNMYGVVHFWRAPSWPEIEAEQLAAADKVLPASTHRLAEELANPFARRGRWKEAAVEAVEAIESQPTNHLFFHMLAPLLVATGDLAGYRQHCQKALLQFGATTDPDTADRMAKDCLIVPDSGVDLGAVNAWADTAVGVTENHPAIAWHQSVKGLLEFRQGHFAKAAEWLEKVPVKGTHPARDAQVLLLLAMTQQHLKNAPAARAFLAKAAEIMNQKLPQMESGNVGNDWIDWLIAQALWREAIALFGDTGTRKTDKSKTGLP